MPRPPDPHRHARTLTRVTDYVLEHGLAGLSLRPMAAALGTSTRMLLYDFGSKEELVLEVLAEVRRREAALLAEHGAATASPEELLRGIWAWLSAPEREPFLRLFFEVQADSLARPAAYSARARAVVTDWLDRYAAAFTGLAPDEEEDGGPVAATLAIAVVRGLLLDRLSTGDLRRTDDAMARFIALTSR